MSKYYCPFCSSRYQFHDSKSKGHLICGSCGESLVKISFLNSRRIIGVIAASAFLAPLLIMLFYVIEDSIEDIPLRNSDSLALLIIEK